MFQEVAVVRAFAAGEGREIGALVLGLECHSSHQFQLQRCAASVCWILAVVRAEDEDLRLSAFIGAY